MTHDADRLLEADRIEEVIDAPSPAQPVVVIQYRTKLPSWLTGVALLVLIPLVAGAYYRGVPDLVLLVIDTERVRPELRYEQVPGQPDPYPHIYGPLNLDAVVETAPFNPPLS